MAHMKRENEIQKWITRNAMLFTGLCLGVAFWFVEALIHALVFYHAPFIDEVVHPDPHEIWMRSFIVCLFIGFGFFAQCVVNSRKRAEEGQKQLVSELKEAMAEVKRLSGLLPICSSCKKIRDDKGYWNQLEAYIRDHSEVEFSHGICPECEKKLYSELKSSKK
jgi:hypothetical protein